MLHESIEKSAVLYDARQNGHIFVPAPIATENNMISEIETRDWASSNSTLIGHFPKR